MILLLVFQYTQVTTTSEGVLQTIKPVKGAFYDFYTIKDKLVVVEVGGCNYLLCFWWSSFLLCVCSLYLS